jgi:hypothetical protein
MDPQQSARITSAGDGTSWVRLTRYEIEAMGMRPWMELNQYPHYYQSGAVNGDDARVWRVPDQDLAWLIMKYGGEFLCDEDDLEAPYMPTSWTTILGK